MKIQYNATLPELPVKLKGESFNHIIGNFFIQSASYILKEHHGPHLKIF